MKNSPLLTRNRIEASAPGDLHAATDYLQTVRAFARITYSSVYVIDYATMSFEYISDNPLFLSGYSVDEVMEMGYTFYFKCVPEPEIRMLELINEEGFNFFETLSLEEKTEYHISYDFHLVNADGKAILINHKLTPLFLNEQGKLWKAMCVVSLSHRQQAGNITIQRQGSDAYWTLDTGSRLWRRELKTPLTEREKDVLRLYAQGLTINQIAARLFVAPDTVKYHRRRIFESFGVGSIVEALAHAVNHKLV